MFPQIRNITLKKAVPRAAFIYFSRNLYETHYDVLNLPTNCTAQQIREAFLKLSKEHHPDLNQNRLSHSKILEVNEAYKVLSKPESRRIYDLGLSRPPTYHGTWQQAPGPNPWDSPLFWANRDRSKDRFYKEDEYYGIKGIKRVPNIVIVIYCAILTIAGFSLQILLIRNSLTFQREELINKSLEAEKCLDEVRQTAMTLGNEGQIEALKLKLLGNEK